MTHKNHANQEWCKNPESDAWWRAAAIAKRIEQGLGKLSAVPISTAHAHEPVMFKRQYDFSKEKLS
jgi:hypothetical protein